MILPDIKPVFFLNRLIGDTGAHHLGQAIDVDTMHIEAGFNFRAHGICPGFGAENAAFQTGTAGINALRFKFICNSQKIGRGHHDDVRFEINNQLYLTLCHPATDRDDGAAKGLGPVMSAQTAGKEPITIGDMNSVTRTPAGCADRTRYKLRPVINILLRIANDGRLAGRTA